MGQDISKNMGFLDTQIDYLGKTLDTVSSFAFGKMKRMKGDLKTDGVLKFDKSMSSDHNEYLGQSSRRIDWRSVYLYHNRLKILLRAKSLLDPPKTHRQ